MTHRQATAEDLREAVVMVARWGGLSINTDQVLAFPDDAEGWAIYRVDGYEKA
jgi:hypothetical protein